MRRAVLWMGASLMLLLVAGAMWLFLGDKPGASKPRPTPSVSRQIMSKESVEYLESKLNSPSRKEQSLALATNLRADYLHGKERMLPPHVVVTIEPYTFRVNGTDGLVDATVSTGQTYFIRLSHEQGRWLVVYTGVK